MTQKDYVAIAAAIRCEYEKDNGREFRDGVRRVADNVADVCAADNPRFDRGKFLKAALGR